MKLRPLGSNVHLQPVKAREVSTGGIVLPQGEKTGGREATVLAAASGLDAASQALLEPGRRVLYERQAPTIDAGEGTVIVNIDHILAVLG